MPENYGYAWEKLMEAICIMASSGAPLKDRIFTAADGPLMHLRSDDFPKELRGRVEDLSRKIYKYRSGVSASQEELETLAREIVYLYNEICARHYA